MKEPILSKSNEEGTSEKLDRIAIALERIADALESDKELPEEEYEKSVRFEKPIVEVPSEIKSATAEELAAELVDFAKKEFPDSERVYIPKVSQLFWGQKNISKWDMPPEIKFKIEKAEILAGNFVDKQFDAKREVRNNEQLEKEKTELPSLVSSCIDWAKEHGLNRVTQADVYAFLLNKNI